jgi:RNA polymerase sigma factor (sigma-70 family)
MSVDFGVGSAEDWSMPEAPGAGDRRVFAHVYDTYAVHLFDYCAGVLRNPAAAANAVQDTLIAADTQIGKLRDYERLPVWLYSIARRQCLSEHAGRSETATPDGLDADYDFGEEYFDSAGLDLAESDGAGTGLDGAESEMPDAEAAGQDRETLRVVKAALDGLSDRDREVLNLAYRHGVDDAGLAATLGVSTGRAHALVSSASTRFEKSTAVVAMLSRGWARCPALEDIAGNWDPASPRLTPILLDRLIRHIGSCGNCSQSRGYTVLGPDLLGAVPLATPPAALRFRITSTAADAAADSYRRRVARRIGSLDKDGFPVQSARQRSMMIMMAVSSAALVVLIVGGAVLYKHTFASSARPGATAAAAASGTAPGSSAPNSAAHAGRSPARRHVLAPFPGGLFGPSPAPAGVPPVPLPHSSGPSPSPKHTRHSKSPSPSPSATHSTSPPPTSPPPTSPPPTSPPPTSPPPTSPPPTSPPPSP